MGDIKPCNNIFIQGVGGKTKVSGHGTMKLRITDDDGKLHELVISNTLYVPECPTNLISPQRWSSSCKEPHGTGEITVGNNTLLFWDDKQFSKLVPHHPELGISLITVNDGYTKGSAFFNTQTCQPCTPAYLQTSTVVEDKHERIHIIPVED